MRANSVKTANISAQIDRINNIFFRRYIELLSAEPQHKNAAEKLNDIFEFQKQSRSHEEWNEFLKEKFAVEGEFDSLDKFKNPLLVEVLGHYAKISDVFRRLRSVANQQYFDLHYRNKVADSLDYVLDVFAKNNLPKEEVQDFFNQANYNPSTTAHPTNPHSVEYTKLAMDLVKDIAEGKKIEAAKIDEFIDAKVWGAKKTQEKEVEEGIAYLDAIYDAVDVEYDKMQKAVAKSKYKDVKIPDDINKFAVWITGDGDGNVNSTEATLEHNVKEFKKRIKEKYAQEMQSIGIDFKNFNLNSSKNPQELIDFLNQQKQYFGAQKIDNLIRKVKVFGYHYAKIDIRQESNDIMKATKTILKHLGVIKEGQDLTYEELIEFSKNKETIFKMMALDHKAVKFSENEAEDELTKRIFGRFKIAAKNPEMFEKIIIAEFKDKKQIAALAFLLKASGNKFAEVGSNLSIVPLAESVDDLKKMPQEIAQVLSDENYLDHIKKTKEIHMMVAKSDTVRRNGVGAQIYQELAIRESIKATIRTLIEQGITNLGEYKIVPFNGGGNALQRGGGRVTEIPSVYGRYILKALGELKEEYKDQQEILAQIDEIKIPSPCLTIQGRQNDILYAPSGVGAGTLEAFASQSVYAAARKTGAIADKEVDDEIAKDKSAQEIKAIQKRAETAVINICDSAMQYYTKHIGDETSKDVTPIDKLFRNACWVSTMSNNVSSRASKRGVAEDAGAVKTVLQSKNGGGDNNRLQRQRAIGAEKICAHSGTHLLSWFSWAEGLQTALENGVDLHEVFLSSKAFRDYMRSAAMSLYMTDFNISWRLMFDIQHPSEQEIADNAKQYRLKMFEGRSDEITDKETLSFIESESQRTKELVYNAITGKQAQQGFDLMEKFPDIKEEIDSRRRTGDLAGFLQAKFNYVANQNESEKLTEDLQSVVRNLYSSYNNTASAAIGVMLTSTKTRANENEAPQLRVPLNSEITLFAQPDAKIVSEFNAQTLQNERYLVQSL